MAKNIYNSNHMRTISWTNDSGAAVSAGDIVMLGNSANNGRVTVAVALVDIGIGATGSVGVNCGIVAPKTSANSWKHGEAVHWTGTEFTNAYGALPFGAVTGVTAAMADSDASNGDAEARVWLTGVPATADNAS